MEGGREFMVCVDRIIASSSSTSAAACSEPSVNNDNGEMLLSVDAKNDDNVALSFKNEENSDGVVMVLKCQESENGNVGEARLKGKNGNLRECRICQEEDAEQDMETPCACNGTLKFAHRECIQRWCKKKGDISRESCNQIFSPDYTLPPKQSNAEVMAIDVS